MWMKIRFWLLGPLLALVIVACQPGEEETPTHGKLKTLTSESHQYIIQKQADTFNSLYENAHVSVAGTSTRECFVHLINDSVRLVVTDRQMNAEERRIVEQAELEIEELKVATDALALLVNDLNELQSITLTLLREIVKGNIRDWDRFPEAKLTGPIAFVATDKNSGAYELLKYHFLKLEQDFVPAVAMDRQAQVVEYVAKNPQAIGLASLACYKDSSLKSLTEGKVRSLAIAGVDSAGNPTKYTLHQYYVYHELYPLHYPIYVYFNTKSKLAMGFSAFVASAPGQKIITKIGLAPATMPVRFVKQTKEEY